MNHHENEVELIAFSSEIIKVLDLESDVCQIIKVFFRDWKHRNL